MTVPCEIDGVPFADSKLRFYRPLILPMQNFREVEKDILNKEYLLVGGRLFNMENDECNQNSDSDDTPAFMKLVIRFEKSDDSLKPIKLSLESLSHLDQHFFGCRLRDVSSGTQFDTMHASAAWQPASARQSRQLRCLDWRFRVVS